MTEDDEYPRRGYDTKDVEAMQAEARRGRGGRWWKFALLGLLLVPVLGFALWAWVSLSFTYSASDRAGYVQKFGRKGWLCKTWEGELAMVTLPGALPEIWNFTVRDDSVANEIMRQMGNRVSLAYEEKRGVPTTCFGDTQYYVVGVRPLDGAAPPAPASQAPGSPAPPGPAPVPPPRPPTP